MLERLFNGGSLFRRTGHKTMRSPPVPCDPHGKAELFLAVGKPAGFWREPVLPIDLFLDLRIGGGLAHGSMQHVKPPFLHSALRIRSSLASQRPDEDSWDRSVQRPRRSSWVSSGLAHRIENTVRHSFPDPDFWTTSADRAGVRRSRYAWDGPELGRSRL
jgi:hypothetical protein